VSKCSERQRLWGRMAASAQVSLCLFQPNFVSESLSLLQPTLGCKARRLPGPPAGLPPGGHCRPWPLSCPRSPQWQRALAEARACGTPPSMSLTGRFGSPAAKDGAIQQTASAAVCSPPRRKRHILRGLSKWAPIRKFAAAAAAAAAARCSQLSAQRCRVLCAGASLLTVAGHAAGGLRLGSDGR